MLIKQLVNARRRTSRLAAAGALAAMAAVGCGGGGGGDSAPPTSPPGGQTPGTGGGNVEWQAPLADHFIAGLVDGVNLSGLYHPANEDNASNPRITHWQYSYNQDTPSSASYLAAIGQGVAVNSSLTVQWDLAFNQRIESNRIGKNNPYYCGGGIAIQLVSVDLNNPQSPFYSTDSQLGGNCTIWFDKVTENNITGTFTAVLAPRDSSQKAKTVSQGAFSLRNSAFTGDSQAGVVEINSNFSTNGGQLSAGSGFPIINQGFISSPTISPKIELLQLPNKAVSYAIIMETSAKGDADGRDIAGCSQKPCVHWSAFNIPRTKTVISEGENLAGISGAIVGTPYTGPTKRYVKNQITQPSWDETPPVQTYSTEYSITVYALSSNVHTSARYLNRAEFEAEFGNQIIGRTVWNGVYEFEGDADYVYDGLEGAVVVSSNFSTNNGQYTADGRIPSVTPGFITRTNVSPEIKLLQAPVQAKSWAVIMESPDEACGSKPCLHWSAFNIPTTKKIIGEGENLKTLSGVMLGNNYLGKEGYSGPVQRYIKNQLIEIPWGQEPPVQYYQSEYAITVYALDGHVDSGARQMGRAEFEAAFRNLIIGRTVWNGAYEFEGDVDFVYKGMEGSLVISSNFSRNEGKYTVDGAIPGIINGFTSRPNISPEVQLLQIPGQATHWAIIMESDNSQNCATPCWSIFNIPTTKTMIGEGENLSEIAGVTERKRYSIINTQAGSNYSITVYALRGAIPPNTENLSRRAFEQTFRSQIIGRTVWNGVHGNNSNAEEISLTVMPSSSINQSPALGIVTSIPSRAQYWAIIMESVGSKNCSTPCWTVFNIPAAKRSISEGENLGVTSGANVKKRYSLLEYEPGFVYSIHAYALIDEIPANTGNITTKDFERDFHEIIIGHDVWTARTVN